MSNPKSERLISQQMVADKWIASEPTVIDTVVNQMHHEVGKAIADVISDGNEYIFRVENSKKEIPERSETAFKTEIVYQPLVRCKKCRFSGSVLTSFSIDGEANYVERFCKVHRCDVKDDDFCPYGELSVKPPQEYQGRSDQW